MKFTLAYRVKTFHRFNIDLYRVFFRFYYQNEKIKTVYSFTFILFNGSAGAGLSTT